MRRTSTVVLLVLVLVVVAVGAFPILQKRRAERADVAACVGVTDPDLFACERAGRRELEAGHARAAADYLLMACSDGGENGGIDEACTLVDELGPVLVDGKSCTIRPSAGADAAGLSLLAVRGKATSTDCGMSPDEINANWGLCNVFVTKPVPPDYTGPGTIIPANATVTMHSTVRLPVGESSTATIPVNGQKNAETATAAPGVEL